MADPVQPDEVQLPIGYEVGTTIVEPLPAERAYPLKNPDFLTLCDGADSKERAGRDLYFGSFVSAMIGIAGMLSCVDWLTVFKEKEWLLLGCFVALLIIAAASACGWGVHWNRMRREDSTYTRLKKTISEFFEAKTSNIV
jgi:hypothetical protein